MAQIALETAYSERHVYRLVRDAMLARAERLGYDTHMLRYTQHLRTGP